MLGHTRRRDTLAATAVAAVAVSAAIGCGGGDSGAPRGAFAAVDALQRAFAHGDTGGVCKRMSAAARRQAGTFAHGRVDACPRDLVEAFEVVQPTSIRGTRPLPRVTDVEGDDERAVATATTAVGGRLAVPLVEEDGEWRVDSFFGDSPRMARATAAELETRPFPAAGSRPVTVSDGPALECFPLVTDRLPEVEGGCRMTATGAGVRLAIDTVFGRQDFGHCKLDLGIVSDGAGRTLTPSVSFGAPGSAGCADMDPCRDADGEVLPWKGRIVYRPDGLRHVVDACMDTCVGYFTGRLSMRMERRHRAWVLSSDGAMIGRSGLALYGELRMRPAAIEVSTR